MTDRVHFIVVDRAGSIQMRGECPPEMVEQYEGDGARVVMLAAQAPLGDWRVDMRRLRRDRNHRHDFGLIATPRKLSQGEAEARVVIARLEAIERVDRHFVAQIATELGPLADVHARKRQQAEAGAGPLVADEADRLAILENAARQDAAIAEIEHTRRAAKARLRAARTSEEIEEALAASLDDKLFDNP